MRHDRPWLALLALALACAPAVAQTLTADAAALAEAKRQAVLAQRRSAALELQATRAADEAARARAQAAAIAARVAAAEADVAAAEARIRIVQTLRARQRTRLAAQQAPIVGLAAGLEVMARRPPALALVQRGSLADLVHVRAVLAGQLPLIHARTEVLRREVAEGVRLQTQADRAAATLRDGRRRLAEQRTALAALAHSHSASAQRFVDDAMHEEDRATALGEEARDIVDLMGRVEAQTALAARLARLAGPQPRPPIPGHRPQPAPDQAGGAPPYRLPVAGRLVTGFGEVASSGVRARGVTVAAAAGARVVAPGGGRIVYAAPFRDYGRIVIIDHGGGWTSLVTSLAAVSVHRGDSVARGDPIGRAVGPRSGLTVELRRNGRAVDLVPLASAG